MAVGGAAFWVGMQSVPEEPPVLSRHAAPTTTVRLPQARPAEPQVRIPAQPQVNPLPEPQVRPAPVREVRIAVPSAVRSRASEALAKPSTESETTEESQAPVETKAPVKSSATAPTSSPFVIPKPWNPRIFAGAAGRVVQIGAFGSIAQAKQGWSYMAHSYPAMARLPAVVRPSQNSKGRIFYRFQVGTTSQAHSEVLCQRMEAIHLSCAVVGLPWKSKVER